MAAIPPIASGTVVPAGAAAPKTVRSQYPNYYFDKLFDGLPAELNLKICEHINPRTRIRTSEGLAHFQPVPRLDATTLNHLKAAHKHNELIPLITTLSLVNKKSYKYFEEYRELAYNHVISFVRQMNHYRSFEICVETGYFLHVLKTFYSRLPVCLDLAYVQRSDKWMRSILRAAVAPYKASSNGGPNFLQLEFCRHRSYVDFIHFVLEQDFRYNLNLYTKERATAAEEGGPILAFVEKLHNNARDKAIQAVFAHVIVMLKSHEKRIDDRNAAAFAETMRRYPTFDAPSVNYSSSSSSSSSSPTSQGPGSTTKKQKTRKKQ